jgi:hypothetical protein
MGFNTLEKHSRLSMAFAYKSYGSGFESAMYHIFLYLNSFHNIITRLSDLGRNKRGKCDF